MRVALAGMARSIILIGMILVPAVISGAAAVSLRSVAATEAEREAMFTQGHWAVINVVEPLDSPAGMHSAVERLGSEVRAAATRIEIYNAPIGGDSATVQGRYLETDAPWSTLAALYRIETGTWPERVGQIAISTQTAKRLGVGVGSSVTLGLDDTTEFDVSGIVVSRTGFDAVVTLAPLGTWRTIGVSEYVQSGLMRVDWLMLDPIDSSSSPVLDSPTSMYASTIVGAQPAYLRNPMLVLGPLFVLMAGISIAGFALRLRRLRQDFLVLASLGMRYGPIKAGIVLSNVVLAVAAAVVGWLIGAGLGTVLARPIASMFNREPTGQPWPNTLGLGFVGIMTLFAVVTGLLAARRVRDDVRQGGGAKASSDSIPIVHRRSWLLRVAQVLALAGTFVAFAVGNRDLTSAVVACGCFAVFGAISGPDMLKVVAWVSERVGSNPVPAIVVHRDRARTGAIAGLALVALLLPISVMTFQSSLDAHALRVYVGDRPAGQVRVNSHHVVLGDQALADISAAAGTEAVPRRVLTNSSGGSFTAAPRGARGEIALVDDAAQAQAITGYELLPDDEQALLEGKVVVLLPGWSGDSIEVEGEVGVDPSITLPAVGAEGRPEPTTTGVALAVMSTAAPIPAGARSTTVDYRIPGASGELQQIRDAALTHRVLPEDVTIDTGPLLDDNVMSQLIAVMGLVLGFLAAVLAAASGTMERRALRLQLQQLGMRPRTLRLDTMLFAWLPVAVGAVFGVVGAIALAEARLRTSGIIVSVPWAQISVVVVGLVAATALAAAFAGLKRLV